MIYSILANVALALALIMSIRWGLKRGQKATQMKKNIDVLVDHERTETEVKAVQNRVKKKIIEAKNEKESDAVIRHIFSVANNSKL